MCVHTFIGKLKDGSIATYQTLPWNHRGWHAGGGANNTHIGFEICEDNLTDKLTLIKFFKKRLNCARIFVNNTNKLRKILVVIMKVIKRRLLVIMVTRVIGFLNLAHQWLRSEQM